MKFRDHSKKARRSPRERLASLVVALVVGGTPVIFAAAPAEAATPFTTITSAGGPLTSVTIGNDLGCQVGHTGDADLEFYPSSAPVGDCGTFLFTGGTLYAPDFDNHEGTATNIGTYTPFTPVSQSAVTGSGTTSDPFRIVTTVGAGTSGLRVTETDTYVVGQEAYRTDTSVTNTTAASVTGVLWRAADCYLAGSDSGYGIMDATARSVGCREDTATSPGSRIEQWVPISRGNHFYEAGYNDVWTKIGTHGAFDDTCQCAVSQDNGAGLSWNLTVPAHSALIRSHLTAFSPTGTLPLSMDKTADHAQSGPNGTNGYTITVYNGNTTAKSVNSISDNLPAGFTYKAGSTTGVTTANPGIAGQMLTWTGPFSVPASASIALHFNVTASAVLGDFFNEANADGGSVAVAGTGPTAQISIVAGGCTLYGTASNDTLTGTASNDVLCGLAGNDTISGGLGNDTLLGGDGNDVLAGQAGADTLTGGAGIDTASYAASPAAVTVNLSTAAVSGGDAASDIIGTIEGVTGSPLADTLTGDAAANALNGAAGDDVLAGLAGADTLTGGDGVDTVTYAASAAAVTVNLTTGTGLGGDAAGDIIGTVENVTGSALGDALTGSATANVLDGAAGNDTLAGRAGADTITGGAGVDIASYAASPAGVTVNFATATASGGDAVGDVIGTVEGVTGSAFVDALTGDAGVNVLRGGASNDVLRGGLGNDTLFGGLGIDQLFGDSGVDTLNGDAGNDVLSGGAGNDVLRGGDGNDTLKPGAGNDNVAGGGGIDLLSLASATVHVTINLSTNQAVGEGTDTLATIENATGSAYADTLVGSGLANRLLGVGGNDTIKGVGGNDVLGGGAGNDRFDGGAGTDTCNQDTGTAPSAPISCEHYNP